MAKITEIPIDEVDYWRGVACDKCASELFRDLANRYCIGRTELAMIASNIYKDIGLDQVQAVWKWDFSKEGRGLPDASLDKAFSCLEIRKT